MAPRDATASGNLIHHLAAKDNDQVQFDEEAANQLTKATAGWKKYVGPKKGATDESTWAWKAKAKDCKSGKGGKGGKGSSKTKDSKSTKSAKTGVPKSAKTGVPKSAKTGDPKSAMPEALIAEDVDNLSTNTTSNSSKSFICEDEDGSDDGSDDRSDDGSDDRSDDGTDDQGGGNVTGGNVTGENVTDWNNTSSLTPTSNPTPSPFDPEPDVCAMIGAQTRPTNPDLDPDRLASFDAVLSITYDTNSDAQLYIAEDVATILMELEKPVAL
jgi:hypothetical protein